MSPYLRIAEYRGETRGFAERFRSKSCYCNIHGSEGELSVRRWVEPESSHTMGWTHPHSRFESGD